MVDNLKSAVLQRLAGEAPVFNPRYLDAARHWGFDIVACNVRKGNEYGVEKNMCCSITNEAKAASLRKSNSTYYSATVCGERPSGRAGRAIDFVLRQRLPLRMSPAPAPLFPD